MTAVCLPGDLCPHLQREELRLEQSSDSHADITGKEPPSSGQGPSAVWRVRAGHHVLGSGLWSCWGKPRWGARGVGEVLGPGRQIQLGFGEGSEPPYSSLHLGERRLGTNRSPGRLGVEEKPQVEGSPSSMTNHGPRDAEHLLLHCGQSRHPCLGKQGRGDGTRCAWPCRELGQSQAWSPGFAVPVSGPSALRSSVLQSEAGEELWAGMYFPLGSCWSGSEQLAEMRHGDRHPPSWLQTLPGSQPHPRGSWGPWSCGSFPFSEDLPVSAARGVSPMQSHRLCWLGLVSPGLLFSLSHRV